MGDLNDVRAHLADQGRDIGQEAGTIITNDPEADQTLGADQFAGQDRGQEPCVDIAAAKDQPTLLAAELFGKG